MYVAQPLENAVRVYSQSGRFLRRIGRKGRGPGEIVGINAITLTTAGLFVLDQAQSRLTLFGLDGSTVRTWPAMRHFWGEPYFPMPPMVQMHDGTVVSIPDYRSPEGTKTPLQPIGLFTASGKYIRDIVWMRTGNITRRVSHGGVTAVIPIPNAVGTLYAILPSENAVVAVDRFIGDDRSKSSYTLTKINTDGDTVFTRRYEVQARPVSAEFVKREKDRLAEINSRNRPATPAQARILLDLAWTDLRYQTPVDQMVAGTDGTIWLRGGAFGNTSASWWAHDGRGNLIGTATLPSETRMLRGNSTTIWTSEKDEDGVDFLVRYSVTPSNK